jgi:hypothetical protein
MSPADVKTYLAREAKRAWPNVTKASNLPYSEFWKAQMKWLIFHSPRIGDALMLELIKDSVVIALEAEKKGIEPKAYVVPEEVRKIWEKVEEVKKHEAWDNAAERADAVRRRFSKPMSGSRIRYAGGTL